MSKGFVKMINGKRVATPEYRSWQMAKNRCLNPKARDFQYYGGRGIKMCDEWVKSFDSFLNDMGLRPSPLHTLDRENNEGGYTPDNCQWATRKQQARNRPYADKKAWEVAAYLGIKQMTYYHCLWQLRHLRAGNLQHVQMSPARIKSIMDALDKFGVSL